MSLIKHFIFALVAIIFCASHNVALATDSITQDRNAAVIMVYQRIGENFHSSTNLQTDQFESHIEEIISGDYNVIPLSEIITALTENTDLPSQTIAITFDGAHSSILDTAVPLLLEQDIPFTIFVAPSQIREQTTQYLSWHALKKLARNRLVTIGLHPANYTRLTAKDTSEIKRQINSGRALLRDKLDIEAQFFAYPFGEYSSAYHDIVKEAGFIAAFGQQSSVANSSNDLFALPRFAMTEDYGSIDRFRLTAGALPLPVSVVQPADPHLLKASSRVGFTVDKELETQILRLSCFVSGQKKPQIEIIGKNRIQLHLQEPIEEERTRVNCTMPGPPLDKETNEGPRWRWFGMLMTRPTSD